MAALEYCESANKDKKEGESGIMCDVANSQIQTSEAPNAASIENMPFKVLIGKFIYNLNCRKHVWNLCLPQPPHPKDEERNP